MRACRSFLRSPVAFRLRGANFTVTGSNRENHSVMYGEHVTGVYHLDIDRLEVVFGACVRAVHYRDTRQKHADWGIVMPRCVFDFNVPEQFVQNWNRLCEALKSFQFERKGTANPSVFAYGVAQLEGKHVYLHVFYGSFLVYALELSKEAAAARLLKKSAVP